ncbi:MAG: hypothetical protein AAF960_26760 [Bacteroidota bacterium]
MNEIYVFKTSITSYVEVQLVNSTLQKVTSIKKWSFDLEDCDNVLRVVSKENVSQHIIDELQGLNIWCEEL